VLGSAGSSQVGVSALGYPSGHAGPPDSGSQMSRSLATGIAEAESSANKLEQAPYTSSRQPPAATAAAETAAAGGPTLAPTYDRPTRRAQSLSARSSSSFRSLSPPAYVIDQPEPGLHRTGRVAASSQRVVSPRARSQRSLSPSQSTFSYGAPGKRAVKRVCVYCCTPTM